MQSRSHRTSDEGSWLSYRSLLVRTRRRRSVVLGGHDYPFAREQQKRTTPLLLFEGSGTAVSLSLLHKGGGAA
jgi:hypothetical protein